MRNLELFEAVAKGELSPAQAAARMSKPIGSSGGDSLIPGSAAPAITIKRVTEGWLASDSRWTVSGISPLDCILRLDAARKLGGDAGEAAADRFMSTVERQTRIDARAVCLLRLIGLNASDELVLAELAALRDCVDSWVASRA